MGSSIKHFLIIGIAVIFAVTFLVSNYLTNYIVNSTIKDSIASIHKEVADSYTKRIWCRFLPALSEIKDQDIAIWQNNDAFTKFSLLSETVLKTSGITRISISNSKGNEFFATNKANVVYSSKDPSAIKDLSKGVFLPSVAFYHESDLLGKDDYIYTKLPLDNSECKDVNQTNALTANIELMSDITAATKPIFWMKIYIIIAVILVFSFFYIGFYLSSQKTERIINKQHEEKLNLEKAKSQAESQNQEKSMFLANVSHELRTPLNAIIGFSEIIKDEVMGPVGHQQYREYINDINSSGVHLLSLINDILDYSKAEARKLELEAVDVDLAKTAHNCMRLVQPRADAAKVNLVENIPARPVVLSADPKRMKQIILNLLSNSVKFTPENGKVTLSLREDILEESIVLTVEDTGIGIAPKDISKAMAPFGQIDSSLSRKHDGTGLGLPLTKKLTDIMGGKFDIKSEVGVGTVITLSFPMKKTKPKEDKKGF